MVLGSVIRGTPPVFEFGLKLTAWLQPLTWLSAWQSYLSGSAHLVNRLGSEPVLYRIPGDDRPVRNRGRPRPERSRRSSTES